jgi:hypothetical protein
VLRVGGAARRGGLHGLDTGAAGGVLLAVARAGGDPRRRERRKMPPRLRRRGDRGVVGDESSVLRHGGSSCEIDRRQTKERATSRRKTRTAGGRGSVDLWLRMALKGGGGLLRPGSDAERGLYR